MIAVTALKLYKADCILKLTLTHIASYLKQYKYKVTTLVNSPHARITCKHAYYEKTSPRPRPPALLSHHSSPELDTTDTGHSPPPQGTLYTGPARPDTNGLFPARPRPLQGTDTGVSCGSCEPWHGPGATDRPTAAKHKYMPSPESAQGQASLHEETPKKIRNANLFPSTVRPYPTFYH